MIHTCTDCGLVHDTAAPASEDPAVAIARIQAESQVKIAQLAARTEVHVAEVEAETAIDAVEAEGEADVAVAEIIAPELGSPPPEDPAPVVIEAPAEPEQDDELTPPPSGDEQDHETEPLVSAHHRRTGLGMW